MGSLNPRDLAQYIDHTLLKAEATRQDIIRLCQEARQHSFKGVCVNSAFVPLVAEELKGTQVLPVSVVGFPLGAMLAKAKAFETEQAIAAGAKEIDTVIPVGAMKAGELATVEHDLRAVISAAGKVPVKVIIETGLLTPDEIVTACKISEAAGAAFVKTATGFLGRGATVDDIVLMRRSLSAHVQIKASGGVKTFEAAQAMIAAGATRLGTSSGVALVTGAVAQQGTY